MSWRKRSDRRRQALFRSEPDECMCPRRSRTSPMAESLSECRGPLDQFRRWGERDLVRLVHGDPDRDARSDESVDRLLRLPRELMGARRDAAPRTCGWT